MKRPNEPPGRRRRLACFSACFAGNVRLATTAVRSLDETDEDDTSTGHKVLPKNPEMFAYDADGNLVSDARFEYAWDAENRLVAAIDRTASTGTAPTGGVRFVVSNAYDHASRRIAKTVFRPEADGTLLLESDSTFLYDGRNPILETRTTPTTTNALSYLWGLDLSGSLQGAGGVGGLLAVTDSEMGTSYPTYDANGNVSEYVSPTGTVLSHYDYSPFGEILISTASHHSPFRFSTKYHDPETGTLYYGYRHYSPRLGRWLSRDPLEENGGDNLLLFCFNAPIGQFDFLGFSSLGGQVGISDFFQFPDSFDLSDLSDIPDFVPQPDENYKPDTSDGLSYREAVLTYFFSNITELSIPADKVGIPIEKELEPCSVKKSRPIEKRGNWESFQTMSHFGWKMGGPGRVEWRLSGSLQFDENCCWVFTGTLIVLDDEFDFNPQKWGTRDNNPNWIQRRIGWNPVRYPKETMTRTVHLFETYLDRHLILKFTPAVIELSGCCDET